MYKDFKFEFGGGMDPVEPPALANAIALIGSEHGFHLPAPSADDQADVSRLKGLLAAHRATGAAIVDSGLFTPALIAASAKLRSAPGVATYMAAVRWAAGTAVRKAELAPREAMLRALMFPLVYATSDFYIGEGEFEMTVDRPAGNAVYSRIVGNGLLAAGHAADAAEVAASLDAVRATFNAVVAVEVGDAPHDHDPELEPDDEIDVEVDLLADGAFLGL